MTTKTLKDALRNHFTERGLQVLDEEISKLIDDWYDVLDNNPLDEVANERIAVLSGLKSALDDIED